MLVQLPVPGPAVARSAIANRIHPDKDVDGFAPVNLGRLVRGEPGLGPLHAERRDVAARPAPACPSRARSAVVVGRSLIVGKPMALLLTARSATVTVAHSRTRDLPALCREADVLVAAVGRPEMIRGDWIKPGAAVIDVGINRTDDGLRGDVAGAEAAEVAGWLTPVPGGVGPMTIAYPAGQHARRRPTPRRRASNTGEPSDQMKIAIFGCTGDLGRGLAINFAAAGHEIVVGSRSQERADQAAATLARGAARLHLHAPGERRRRRSTASWPSCRSPGRASRPRSRRWPTRSPARSWSPWSTR